MQSDGLGGGQAGRVQSIGGQKDASMGDAQRYKSMRDCFQQVWRQEGMVGFWRGLGPTLVRALPVSAGTFAV